MTPMRRCTKCEVEKPLSEFGRLSRAEDGLNTLCRACNSANAKKHYWAKREHYRQLSADYRAKNRDAIIAQRKAFREANRGEIAARRKASFEALSAEEQERLRERSRERNRRYAAKNKAKLAAKNKRWHDSRDTEERKAQQRKWRQENRDKVAIDNHQRRANRVGADGRDYIRVLHGDPCSYCGGPAGEIDRIVPIRGGGGLDWENLTAACRSCNSSKHRRSLLTYMLDNVGGHVPVLARAA